MLKKTIFFKNRISLRPKENERLHRIIILAGLVSLLFYLGSTVFIQNTFFIQHSQAKIKAAEIMQKAVSVIREHCFKSGIKINEMTDPNNTGLIGSEFSGITTTLGHLQAKRTTTNPNFAALIVQLLDEAGVNSGDTIAIGCSASFPASMIASLAATKAMEIQPVIIFSLGASSYGANNPDFNLLNIYQLLLKEKVFDVQPAAISLGGEKDVGEGFESSIQQQLIQQIQESTFPFIYEKDFQKSVKKRMNIYKGNSANQRISAFINCGGSQANMGTSGLALKIKSGLNKDIVEIPAINERGVIFEMAALHIPVIHLLYIKGLILKYGLPWDPIPLPEPGQAGLFNSHSNNNLIFWFISILYFTVLIFLIAFGMKKGNIEMQ